MIEPKLEKFEFDVPTGERDEFVEVWLQYQITVYEPDGGTVIQWPVSGYGKSELIRDPEDAVQRAAIVAMREAGATIATKFSEQPQVKTWLGGKGHAAPVTSDHRQPSTNRPPNPCPRRSSSMSRLRIIGIAAALPLIGACGITSRMEPYKQTDAVIAEGEHVVILARKQHSTHETEEEFVQCISDGLADGKDGPRRALVEGVRGQDVSVVRAVDGAVEHRGSYDAARAPRRARPSAHARAFAI